MIRKICSYTPIATFAENTPRIFVKKYKRGASVATTDITEALEKILSDQYFVDVLAACKNKTIALKPNMAGIYPKDVRGLTTSMEVVEGIIAYLKKSRRKLKYKSLCIVESTSINLPNSSEYMFRVTGLLDISRKHEIPLIDVKQDTYFKIEKKFKYIDEILVSSQVKQAGILINIPVMKGHPLTMCCKNLMGLLADPYKPKMHTDLMHKIPELARILRPTINIVDGLYGAMNHAGEAICNLRSKKFNTLLVALDPLAADFYASKKWGYQEKTISTLDFKYGENIQLGKTEHQIISYD